MTTTELDRLFLSPQFGPIRRWKEGDILWLENELAIIAYAVTDDPEKIGSLGLHGPDEMCVQYISIEQAKPWNDDTTQKNGFHWRGKPIESYSKQEIYDILEMPNVAIQLTALETIAILKIAAKKS